ncbi:MAG: ABC transporter ATP-binding protein [Clostridia bacterium]|nr:ABC transporter ATP-binding protein [Clostridia bacterium]
MIEVKNVSLTYYQENTTTQALANVNLHIGPKESWVFIGPSGCGKSSLLFLLAGLRRPTSGEVSVAGAPISSPRPQTALILQDYGLFPWKTVRDNTALGLKLRGISAREQEAIITPILENLGLAEHKHHFPAQLSGGQRQRVAVARALALNPDLLLMDEPFSSLDALTRENLQETMVDIWQQKGMTLITVTHSIEEAVFLGQKIAIFSPRPARLVSIVDNPLAGDRSFRDHPDFYRLCARVRHLLEEVTR